MVYSEPVNTFNASEFDTPTVNWRDLDLVGTDGLKVSPVDAIGELADLRDGGYMCGVYFAPTAQQVEEGIEPYEVPAPLIDWAGFPTKAERLQPVYTESYHHADGVHVMEARLTANTGRDLVTAQGVVVGEFFDGWVTSWGSTVFRDIEVPIVCLHSVMTVYAEQTGEL